jgi:hypothetical protein
MWEDGQIFQQGWLFTNNQKDPVHLKILLQPSEVQNTSFKFTLSKPIYIKLYMNFWLQLNNWPMQLIHLSRLSPGG